MALDRDAFFLLQIHRVEHLVFHFPLIERMRPLEHPVGQRALSVIDMGDDAEIPDVLHAAKIDKKSGSRRFFHFCFYFEGCCGCFRKLLIIRCWKASSA